MTTETRSVAEIMGWHLVTSWGDSGPYEVRKYSNGAAIRFVGDPDPDDGLTITPDDMLAWLRERYPHITINTWSWRDGDARQGDYEDVQSYQVRLSKVGARDDDIWISPDRTTLHAALEAAVRAVVGEAGE